MMDELCIVHPEQDDEELLIGEVSDEVLEAPQEQKRGPDGLGSLQRSR